MFEQYTHLLIPEPTDFVPLPACVAGLWESLAKVGGVPREASFRLGTLSGRMRQGRDCLTGETIEIPGWDYSPLTSVLELPARLTGLNDYSLLLEGKGPANLPPFDLYTVNGTRFTEAYDYSICLHLRKERIVFDKAGKSANHDSPNGQVARFHHPETGAPIDVAGAASARFWIAVEFGRWLLPKIGDSLEIVDPVFLANLSESLGLGLLQGCSTY